MSEKLTAEASLQKNNAHLHWCEFHGQRRFYVSCAHIVTAWKKGELDDETNIMADCAMAMNRGACAAIKMRAKEEKKDEAIYFQERKRADGSQLNVGGEKVDLAAAHKNKSYWNGWNQLGKSKADVPKLQKIAKKEEPAIVNMDMGQIVTDLAAEESKAVKPAAEKKPAKPMQGESMLEMAKRMMAEKRGATQ